MNIIKPHTTVSRKVESWSEIKDIASELRDYATNGKFIGEFGACFALHHAQVSETPYNFFAISAKGQSAKELRLPSWCIVNPEIILARDREWIAVGGVERMRHNTYRPMEGCMSYPYRKLKKVGRFYKIKVRFQYPKLSLTGYELATFEGDIEGLTAQVFQHEFDHGQGKTIMNNG